nr:hypothetical protein [Microbispora sp. GKU 823]
MIAVAVTGLLRLARRNNDVGWARTGPDVELYPRASTSLPCRTTASEAYEMLRASMKLFSRSSKGCSDGELEPVTVQAGGVSAAIAERAGDAAAPTTAPASRRSESLRVSMSRSPFSGLMTLWTTSKSEDPALV